MKIKSLIGTRLIIEVEPKKSEAGIILPDSALPQGELKTGKVLHVGTEVQGVKVGDTVLFQFGFDAFPALGAEARIGNFGNVIAVVTK